MKSPKSQCRRFSIALTVTACLLFFTPCFAEQQLRLNNGLALNGLMADISSLNQNPFAAAAGGGGVQSRPIRMVDNGLTRIYIHRNGMVAAPAVDVRGVDSIFEFKPEAPVDGKSIQGIGMILGTPTQFNDFGRRTITVRGPDGDPLVIVQQITELNARYAKLESMNKAPSYLWDMRLATSTIDSAALRRIFRRRLDQSNLDRRLEVVRFFIEAKRYAAAHEELSGVLRDFPAEKDMRAMLISITERQVNQLFEEAQRRADVGQEEFARQVYKTIPLDAVGRVTRLQVQDALGKLDDSDKKAASLVAKLRQQVGQLNAGQAARIAPLLNEIAAGLSSATLTRLSDYAQFADADQLPLDNRVALGICGWLLGSGSGEDNLTIAMALIKVRELVHEYLGCDDPNRRQAILRELVNLEGAEPDYVARMLPLLTPAKKWPEGAEAGPGMFSIVPPPSDNPIRTFADYVIQLPPEYNPLREYPCVVALHPPRGTAEEQIEWWAGMFDSRSNTRIGQATRHGYIVVAPRWTRPSQRVYEYTPREHQRVLVSLRDAMRRSSIDADRVFLAGHGEGGTAAWDIAVSHPDSWAGMISIGAEPKKTITHYFPNAEHVPLYMVMGELDGAPAPLIRNGPVLDDYVKVRNDAMVVMYRGHGRGYFPEELPRMFDWMNLPMHVRKDIPDEIDTVTMREGDTFFWWLELDGLKSGTAINPVLWEQAERIRGKKVTASIGAKNNITISQGPTERFTVWLRPGMGIDLNQRVSIQYRSRRANLDFEGSLGVLLDDARQRADRKRPYWAKVTIP